MELMKEKIFKICIAIVGIIFTIKFCVLIIPPFLENPDFGAAFGAGFVNPYAAGYSYDVMCCYIILLIWVVYEMPKIKYGWVCLILGIIPGVALGIALYIIMRTTQLNAKQTAKDKLLQNDI